MIRSLSSLLVLTAMLLLCVPSNLSAQASTKKGAQVTEARLLGKTAPLRDLSPRPPLTDSRLREKARLRKPVERSNFEGNTVMPNPYADVAKPKHGDPLAAMPVQKVLTQVLPEMVIDGMDQEDSGIFPPDPTGDVSPDHYVQATNMAGGSIFSVFDKAGNLLYGPADVGTIWAPFNAGGIGDPIVLWDHEAGRWLISEIGNSQSGFVLLIAVSETSDPLGSWNAYEFQSPSLPDYPKYAVWHDAYYVTTNEFFTENIPVYALNREAMLAGATFAPVQRVEALPKFNNPEAFQVCTASDWDGNTPPPPGSPINLVRIYDDAWDGGQDVLEVWTMSVDWDNPSNTAVTGPITLPTAPFDSYLCDGGDIFNCIPQGDGTLVSALQHVIMHRVAYRNFGTHETMVFTFSVDVNGANQAGIRWVELRKENTGDWYLYQEGTYAPDDLSRFMAGIAIDQAGNILMGYSATGPDTYLSLRFTGRLQGDPLGQMTIEEHEFGAGQSINFNSRWGDYSSMTVDPSDEVTFWFTGEYMKEDNIWGTKIMRTLVQRDSIDLGVAALVAPQSSGYLTAGEPVTVAVRNYGYLPQDTFHLSFQVDQGPLTTEFVSQLIEPDSVYYHTFSPTVDLSTIGDYQFLIYTTLTVDTANFNDTLRTIVRQLPRNDAAISAVTELPSPYCFDELSTALVLKNAGVDTLFSASVFYSLNAGPETQIDWTGALPPNATEPLPVTLNGFVDGANTLLAYSQLPNGLADEDPANDTLMRTFVVPLDGEIITLNLTTDLFPNETTWQLEDEGGLILFEGGPYGFEQTLFSEDWCLAPGCYVFRIFDSFGDGMSYLGVEGEYQIVDEQGTVLASIIEPAFGTEESNDFCLTVDCSLDVTLVAENTSGPDAEDGVIALVVNNGTAPFQYSIDGGTTFTGDPIFTELPVGEYPVAIVDDLGCTYDSLVVITFNVAAEEPLSGVYIRLAPNPGRDHVRLTISGLEGVSTLPVQVLDATGRPVHHDRLVAYDGILQQYLVLDYLPDGVYFIRILHERMHRVLKWVKE